MLKFDNIEEIPARALQSKALFYQDPEYYPSRYQQKVPLQIRMLKTVTGDIPMIIAGSADLIAIGGNTYYCYVNSLGAVTALLPGANELGVKPSEFEVVSFHNLIK